MLPARTALKLAPILAFSALLWGEPPRIQEGPRATPMPVQPMGAGGMGMGTMEGPVRPTPMPVGPVGRFGAGGMDRGSRNTPLPTGGRRIVYYPGTRTVVPPPIWERRAIMPDAAYWQHRDIMAEIQWMARSGFIPVTPVGTGVSSLSDFAQFPAGWRAYGIAVPAGGRIQVSLHHDKLGWFRLLAVNKWGQPGPGMLHAANAYQPVMVTLTNPGKKAEAMYVIVDDPGWWSDQRDPYTLSIRRSWDPLHTDLSQVKMVAGLWGAQPSVSAQFQGPSLTGPAVYPY